MVANDTRNLASSATPLAPAASVLGVSGRAGIVDDRESRPLWRDEPVPHYLAAWFDQLMKSRHIFAGGDRDGRIYCDVLLTMASGQPTKMLPQITWK